MSFSWTAVIMQTNAASLTDGHVRSRSRLRHHTRLSRIINPPLTENLRIDLQEQAGTDPTPLLKPPTHMTSAKCPNLADCAQPCFCNNHPKRQHCDLTNRKRQQYDTSPFSFEYPYPSSHYGYKMTHDPRIPGSSVAMQKMTRLYKGYFPIYAVLV